MNKLICLQGEGFFLNKIVELCPYSPHMSRVAPSDRFNKIHRINSVAQVMKMFESGSPQKTQTGDNNNESGSCSSVDSSFNLSSISKQLQQVNEWKRVLEDRETSLFQQYMKTQHQSMINNRFHSRQLTPPYAAAAESPGSSVSGYSTFSDAAFAQPEVSSEIEFDSGGSGGIGGGGHMMHPTNANEGAISENLKLKMYVKKLEEKLLKQQRGSLDQ